MQLFTLLILAGHIPVNIGAVLSFPLTLMVSFTSLPQASATTYILRIVQSQPLTIVSCVWVTVISLQSVNNAFASSLLKKTEVFAPLRHAFWLLSSEGHIPVRAGAMLSLIRCSWYTSVVLPHASLTVYLITKVSVQAPPCFRLRLMLVRINGVEQSLRLYPRAFTDVKFFTACTVSVTQATADAYTMFLV